MIKIVNFVLGFICFFAALGNDEMKYTIILMFLSLLNFYAIVAPGKNKPNPKHIKIFFKYESHARRDAPY